MNKETHIRILIFSYSQYFPYLFWALKLTYMSDLLVHHCVKSVRIRSYSGPYSVRMRENTDQNNSEYGHFSHNS